MYIEYVRQTPLERRVRPVRAPLPSDMANLTSLIEILRIKYAEQAKESKKDFKMARDELLAEVGQRQHWPKETRNLYASVLSTYIGLDRTAKPQISARLREDIEFAKQLCECRAEEERRFHAS